MTAFEAKDSRSLRLPSIIIAPLVFILYFLCLLGQVLNVRWNDPRLPQIYGGFANPKAHGDASQNTPRSSAMIVLATWDYIGPALAGFLNACLIFSVLSAANTSVYVASRTMYGMARDIPDTNKAGYYAHKLSLVVPKTGVPAAGLVFSAVAFFWLPFLQLKSGYAIDAVGLPHLVPANFRR